MKCVAVFAIVVAIVAADFSDMVEEIEFTQEEASDSLASAINFLQSVSPTEVKYHVARISKHAELLQGYKAKAYAHNFEASRAAIKAALSNLAKELQSGHDHDKNTLAKEKTRLNTATGTARANGKTAVHGYRAKVCPEKRAEEAAEAKEAAALTKLNKVKSDKVCEPNLSSTWTDMDVEKTTPKFGTELRNAWDKARNRWVQAKAEHDKAAAETKAAKQKREKAMASFTTSLSLEASNAHTACKNAAHEYATLCKDVQSNVKTRKQTYIATLVITCYIDNLTSNKSAKSCADKQRSASTSKWDISCGATESCPGKDHWKNSWGPPSWQPTKSNCPVSAPAPPKAPAGAFSFTMVGNSKNKDACKAMRSFRDGLSATKSYSKVVVESVGKGSYTCADPAAATKICQAVKVASSREYAKVDCGGHKWVIGQCGNAEGKPAMEINVAISNAGRICQCQGNGFTLRPCIGHTNSNWGGWGNSCGGKVQQTMKINCY